jgi:heme/copper-type cytochrome/quinol oxidase subunit 4
MSFARILLFCGVAAAALYAGMDVVAGTFLYPGYDFTTQQVSELSAIGAPSRPFWMALGYPFGLLTLAFAAGVWLAATGRLGLRVTAVLIALFAVNGFVWGLVAPMHMRASEFTGTDSMHIAFAASAVLLMLAFIGFGAAAFGRRFRVYSAVTVAAMLAAGGVASTQVGAIAAGQPTPWVGLVERVSVYAPMVWIIVFAAMLTREAADRDPSL